MIGAGLAFGPRAERQVPYDDDDSQAGQNIIAEERRKGTAWIGAGAGTAVAGVFGRAWCSPSGWIWADAVPAVLTIESKVERYWQLWPFG